jgi:hypothetical protein
VEERDGGEIERLVYKYLSVEENARNWFGSLQHRSIIKAKTPLQLNLRSPSKWDLKHLR